MKLSPSSLTLLRETIRKAVGRYTGNGEQTVVTDIHLQPNQGSGELVIFDDEDNELATAIIEEWTTYGDDDFNEKAERILTSLLNDMKKAGQFDTLSILQPFSFVLVDDKKETLAELLLIDDDTVLLNKELLQGLDEELDSFLKELLEK